MKPSALIAALPIATFACSSAPVLNPTRNLQYPVDMTMVCMIRPTAGALTGQPMTACHLSQNDLQSRLDDLQTRLAQGQDPALARQQDPTNDPAVTFSSAGRDQGTFAFITNEGSGQVAVADMNTGRLVDLAPKSPGYGMLPVNGGPQSLAASDDGCWVVTSSRTTCDFSMIDPARLLAGPAFSTSDGTAPPTTTGLGESSQRLTVKTGSGRALSTWTGEIAFLPIAFASPPPVQPPDTPSPFYPFPGCQAENEPLAVATFPGCDMVALVKLSFANASATIVDSYFVRPDLPGGVMPAGAEPVCPNNCAAVSIAAADIDSGIAVGGGGNVDGGAREASIDGGVTPAPASSACADGPCLVQPLAMLPGGGRIYVGSLHDSAIVSFDVGGAQLLNPSRFELAERPLGVNRIRLSVDPFQTTLVGGGAAVMGQLLKARAGFLYAFTRDDSVRVVQITGAAPVECDVNVSFPSACEAQKALPCIPVGTAESICSGMRRRPLAQGPGLRIPVFGNPDSPPPLPRDIAFADLQPKGVFDKPPFGTDQNYHALNGQFGFLLASNGQVYILNIAPNGEDGTPSDPPSTCTTYLPADANTILPATITNSIRATRNVGQCTGIPMSMLITPQRTVSGTDQPFGSVQNYVVDQGPHVLPGPGSTYVDLPDPNTVVSHVWDIEWEGRLLSRETGLVRDGKVLVDSGAQYCTYGVQPGDVVMFSGCTQDTDCQPDNEFSCQQVGSGARSMCLPRDGAKSAGLTQNPGCASLYGSRMRYRVERATQTQLTLGLLLDEVPKSTLDPCTKNEDCRPDQDHGLQLGTAGGVDAGAESQGRPFECIPVHNNDPRCVRWCAKDSECRAGDVCVSVPGTLPPPPPSDGQAQRSNTYCYQAPTLDPTCLSQPASRYSVRAGQSFMVYGSSMPTMHTTAVGPDGTCQSLPQTDPTLVSRIPLSAPACPETFLAQARAATTSAEGQVISPQVFVQNLQAQPGFNPCLYKGARFDGATDAEAAGTRIFFQNPQIRFVMGNVDTYTGDLFGFHFELQYGYSPQAASMPSVEVQVTMGTRILTGPFKTPESPVTISGGAVPISYPFLYVVDQGRTSLTPASHGQVLRINPRSGSNELPSFDTAVTGSAPFQIQ